MLQGTQVIDTVKVGSDSVDRIMHGSNEVWASTLKPDTKNPFNDGSLIRSYLCDDASMVDNVTGSLPTINNTITLLPGVFGNAYKTDYAAISNVYPSVAPGSPMSVSFWIDASAGSNSAKSVLSINDGVYRRITSMVSGGGFGLRVTTDGNTTNYLTVDIGPAGWVFVAVLFTGTQTLVYVNNVLTNSSTTYTETAYTGTNYLASNGMPVLVDQIMIFNKVLSLVEITKLYEMVEA